MPKMKSNRGAAKRFRCSATGKLSFRRSNRNHILTKKSPRRKRRLRAGAQVAAGDRRAVRLMLPYL